MHRAVAALSLLSPVACAFVGAPSSSGGATVARRAAAAHASLTAEALRQAPNPTLANPAEHDILLIFDEIVAFRISPGGAQVRTRSLPLLPAPLRLNGFLPSAFVRAGGVRHHAGPDDAG